MQTSQEKILPYFNKTLILILGLLVLYLSGSLNNINLLILIGLIIVIYFVNELILFFLAAGIIMAWAVIFFVNENWLIYVGNLTYILLFLASIISLIKDKSPVLMPKIDWQRYVGWFLTIILIILLGLTGYGIFKNISKYQNDNNKINWTIELNEPKLAEDLVLKINDLKTEEKFLVAIQKPDGKMFSFEKLLNSKDNKITIYKELLDETGNYQVKIGAGEIMKTKEFSIK